MREIEIFPWDDQFNTGLPEIDAQHRQLAGLVNRLAGCLLHGAGIPAIDALFDTIVAFSHDHINREKALWQAYCTEIEAEFEPVAVHETFISALTRLQSLAGSGLLNHEIFNECAAILLSLSDWLAQHILESGRNPVLTSQAVQSNKTGDAAKAPVKQQMNGNVSALHRLVRTMLNRHGASILQAVWTHTKSLHEDEARAEREVLYRTIVNQASMAIDVVDAGTLRFKEVNDSACALLGYTREELIGEPLALIQADLDEAGLRAAAKRFAAAGGQCNVENRYRRSDGRVIDVQLSVKRVTIAAKPCLLGVWQDITEKKRQEEAASQVHAALQAVLEGSNDAIFVKDWAGRYIIANQASAELLGKPLDALLGSDDYSLFSRQRAEQFRADDRRIFLTGQTQTCEEMVATASGQRCYLLTKGPLIMDGKKCGVFRIARDISERKKVEIKLHAQKDLLDLTGHLAHVGGWQFDLVSSQWSVTDEMLSIFALEQGAAFSENLFMSRFDAADRRLMKQAFAAAQDHCRPFEMEREITDATGENKWIHIIGLPVLENGRVVRLEGAVQDVTLRRQTVIALRESENRFRSLTTVAPVGIFRTDIRGGCVYVNPRWCEIAGMRQEDALGDGWLLAIHPDDRKRVARLWKSVTADRQKFLDEYRFLTADGRMTWVIGGSLAEFDGSGQFCGYVGTIADITPLKNTEEALRRSESRYRSLLETAPFPAVLARLSDGTLLYGNERAQMLYGIRRESGMDGTLDRLFHNTGDWQSFLERLREDRRVDELEIRMRGSDEHSFWALISASLVEYGQAPAIFASINDITERKNMEMAVRQLNTELEQRVSLRTAELAEANRELETFTYSVSHDLKAPLRGIDGYSQLLLADYQAQLDDQGRQFLDNVRQGVMQMNRLIDDLLAYSRIDKRNMQGQTLDLSRMVTDLLSERAADFDARSMAVDVRLPNLMLKVDPQGFAMVIRNLVDNAIKFSRNIPEPRLSISASIGEKSVIMRFEDNGIGFDMQFKDSIFDIFQRLQRAEDYPGTGVGLAIVSKAMSRMGGRVWADSIPYSRTIFFLELPR